MEPTCTKVRFEEMCSLLGSPVHHHQELFYILLWDQCLVILTKPLQAYLQFDQIVCASCQLAAAVVLVSRDGLGSS